MTLQSEHIVPSKFELLWIFVLALALMIVGHTEQFLRYYGLAPSTNLLQHHAQHVIGNGLHTLDGYGLTAAVVTFGIWALVGLFCFAFVQGIGHVYQLVREAHELESRRFIHPAALTKLMFWEHLLRDVVLLVLATAVLSLALYGFLAIVLPSGLSDDGSIISLLVGVMGIFGGLIVLDACVRLVIRRRHIFS